MDREFFQRNGLLRAKGEISVDRNHSNSLARCFDEEGMLKLARAQAQRNAGGADSASIANATKGYISSAISRLGALGKRSTNAQTYVNFVAGEEDEY